MSPEKTQKFLSQARLIIERQLKIRLRSEKELIDKLSLKNIPPCIIDQVMAEYRQLGYVNDRQFARAWIISRLKKPFGKRRIRSELIHKGVDKHIINEELSSATQENYAEIEIIIALAEHRIQKYRNLDKVKQRKRLFGYLSRRGFQTEHIVKALKQI